MSEEEGGAEDVSFLRTEDMVALSCTGTGERVCLSAEGFGNRQCFLESIADKVNSLINKLGLGSICQIVRTTDISDIRFNFK